MVGSILLTEQKKGLTSKKINNCEVCRQRPANCLTAAGLTRGSGIPLRRCSALSSCRSSPLHTQLLPSSRSPLLKSVYLQPSLLERKPKRLFRLYRSQIALLIYRLGASRSVAREGLKVANGPCSKGSLCFVGRRAS